MGMDPSVLLGLNSLVAPGIGAATDILGSLFNWGVRQVPALGYGVQATWNQLLEQQALEGLKEPLRQNQANWESGFLDQFHQLQAAGKPLAGQIGGMYQGVLDRQRQDSASILDQMRGSVDQFGRDLQAGVDTANWDVQAQTNAYNDRMRSLREARQQGLNALTFSERMQGESNAASINQEAARQKLMWDADSTLSSAQKARMAGGLATNAAQASGKAMTDTTAAYADKIATYTFGSERDISAEDRAGQGQISSSRQFLAQMQDRYAQSMQSARSRVDLTALQNQQFSATLDQWVQEGTANQMNLDQSIAQKIAGIGMDVENLLKGNRDSLATTLANLDIRKYEGAINVMSQVFSALTGGPSPYPVGVGSQAGQAIGNNSLQFGAMLQARDQGAESGTNWGGIAGAGAGAGLGALAYSSNPWMGAGFGAALGGTLGGSF